MFVISWQIMTLSIYGIPHVRNLKKNIKNNICVLPIMFYGKGISFGIAENYREDICVVSWYSCREVFHDDYPFSNHIFINHSIGAHNLLCNFVNDLESTNQDPMEIFQSLLSGKNNKFINNTMNKVKSKIDKGEINIDFNLDKHKDELNNIDINDISNMVMENIQKMNNKK